MGKEVRAELTHVRMKEPEPILSQIPKGDPCATTSPGHEWTLTPRHKQSRQNLFALQSRLVRVFRSERDARRKHPAIIVGMELGRRDLHAHRSR